MNWHQARVSFSSCPSLLCTEFHLVQYLSLTSYMKSAERLYLVCELQKARGEKIQIISITPQNTEFEGQSL